MVDSSIRIEYDRVRVACRADLKSDEVAKAIIKLVNVSLSFLVEQCEAISLVSMVPSKQYFTYKRDDVVARPANTQFFLGETDAINHLWEQWLGGDIGPDDFVKLSYTAALAPCLAMEMFDRQNKKGPATYTVSRCFKPVHRFLPKRLISTIK
jgi:hypothetical protein